MFATGRAFYPAQNCTLGIRPHFRIRRVLFWQFTVTTGPNKNFYKTILNLDLCNGNFRDFWLFDFTPLFRRFRCNPTISTAFSHFYVLRSKVRLIFPLFLWKKKFSESVRKLSMWLKENAYCLEHTWLVWPFFTLRPRSVSTLQECKAHWRNFQAKIWTKWGPEKFCTFWQIFTTKFDYSTSKSLHELL